jgi:hypothetical protein
MDRSSRFFSLRGPLLGWRLDRSQAADSLTDAHELRAQALPALVLLDLGLRLTESGGRGEGFRNRFSLEGAGETQLRIVPRIKHTTRKRNGGNWVRLPKV